MERKKKRGEKRKKRDWWGDPDSKLVSETEIFSVFQFSVFSSKIKKKLKFVIKNTGNILFQNSLKHAQPFLLALFTAMSKYYLNIAPANSCICRLLCP